MNKIETNEQKLCTLYLNGSSFNDIKRIMGVNQAPATRILKENEIKIRGKSVSRNKLNCHKLNIDFFKKIDSYEKAYWLGVLTADGTIQKDGYKTSLTSKDKDLIIKFKSAISSDHKISLINSFDKRTNKTYSRYIIQICSKEFTKNIIKQGITSNKSYVCNFPKIKNKFICSFIRGLFDGDGSFSIENNVSAKISFTATREILYFIHDFFNKKYNIEPHPIRITSENMNVCRTYYFADTKKILSLLYENSSENSRLNRKYKLFEKLYYKLLCKQNKT